MLIHTGAGAYNHEERYRTDHPGMSGEATRWLIERGVRLMGCDAITFDPPVWAMFEKRKFWEAHRVMWDEEYWHLENLMNLDQIGRPHGFQLSCCRSSGSARPPPRSARWRSSTSDADLRRRGLHRGRPRRRQGRLAGPHDARTGCRCRPASSSRPSGWSPRWATAARSCGPRCPTTSARRRSSAPSSRPAEIVAAYGALGDDPPVAVRSSACAEDGEAASYAGQQETYLYVRGADDVLVRVRDCWASFFSERALFYRQRKGSLDDLDMAVVVQRMVKADVAGVLFTCDPVHHRRDRMVVEAVLGLGEAAVSGEVTPDHYALKRDGTLKRAQVARQPFAIVPADGGGVEKRELGEEGGGAEARRGAAARAGAHRRRPRAAARHAAGHRVRDRGRRDLRAAGEAGDRAVSELLEQCRAWMDEVHPHALHLERTLHWLLELDPHASEPARIAAATHDVERAYPDPSAGWDSARLLGLARVQPLAPGPLRRDGRRRPARARGGRGRSCASPPGSCTCTRTAAGRRPTSCRRPTRCRSWRRWSRPCSPGSRRAAPRASAPRASCATASSASTPACRGRAGSPRRCCTPALSRLRAANDPAEVREALAAGAHGAHAPAGARPLPAHAAVARPSGLRGRLLPHAAGHPGGRRPALGPAQRRLPRAS